ncbi:MAG: helix-turn-helix transcriptional regulator [Clostridiales Family XIII bacterium]|jgi:DNA-binding CsgD family transcriptional regulator|nr:helix-turn-helix transcriptional regulator [Clostridiales Family XIII bacterium]
MELASTDWKAIQNIVLELNGETDIPRALHAFLHSVGSLIPFEKASVYFYSRFAGRFQVDEYFAEGFDEKELVDYDAYYYSIDDILDTMLPRKLHTVRSSELFDMRKRVQTEYYNDYVKPVRTHFSLDANFAWNRGGGGIGFGTLDLFRATCDGDFSDRETEICRVLQPHLGLKVQSFFPPTESPYDQMLAPFRLTRTETEVARLLLQGFTNEQIAEAQHVTVSTIKKQVASVLSKTESSSRVSLLCKLSALQSPTVP